MALRARGWRTSLVQPADAAVTLATSHEAVRDLPAPAGLGSALRERRRSLSTHADVLEQHGYASARFVAQRILLWDRVFRELRPHVVICDHAPDAILACRDRWPAVPVGNAMSLPPVALERYPPLRRAGRTVDPGVVLDAVNEACRLCGRAPLTSLPQLYAGASEGCIALHFMDPYAAARTIPVLPPPAPPEPVASDGPERLVAYLSSMGRRAMHSLLEGIALSGLPARVVAPVAASDASVGGKIELHREAVAKDTLAEGARLALGCGTPGFAADMAWLGVPQVVAGTNFERNVNAALLARHGLAARVAPTELFEPRRIAEILRAAWQDARMRERAATVAADLAAIRDVNAFELLADRIEAV